MNQRQIGIGLLLLVAVGLLTGCGTTAAAAEVTDIPVVAGASSGVVVAEAVIQPARSEELGFKMGGRVVEVLVAEGDAVRAGDAIARLETEDLDRALAQADLGLRQAQLRLAQLERPADERDVVAAESAIADAQAAYNEAVQRLTLTEHSVDAGDAVRAARYGRDETYRVYQDLVARKDEGEGIDDGLLAQAHDAYLDADGRYNRAVENAEFQLLAARNAVNQAARAVEQARLNKDDLLKGVDELDLQAVQLEIEAAELALEAAEDALEDATLLAPFDGVVAALNIDVADTVSPGGPVLVLATLDRLQAVTKDLTELDVVRVAAEQPAVVQVDALEDVSFEGVVSEISLQPGDYRGDVVYTVVIDLVDVADSPLRWGMTALVEIAVE